MRDEISGVVYTTYVDGISTFGARWLACSLVGAVLPDRREEVDLGAVKWASKSGVQLGGQLVGIVGPQELRVVLRYSYAQNEMVPPKAGARPGFEQFERQLDRHGRLEVACKWYFPPASVVARIDDFYAVALSVLEML